MKSIQFSANKRFVVTISGDQSEGLADMASSKEVHVLRGHEGPVWNAQWASDGKTVVTASDDKTARFWDVTSGKELHVLRHE